jgi:hypothetical protein
MKISAVPRHGAVWLRGWTWASAMSLAEANPWMMRQEHLISQFPMLITAWSDLQKTPIGWLPIWVTERQEPLNLFIMRLKVEK